MDRRRGVKLLGALAALAVITLVLVGSSAIASGGSAGTDIGNAAELTGTASGTLADATQDDWYVVYPTKVGGLVDVTVTNTTPASPATGCQNVSADPTDYLGNSLGRQDITINSKQDFAVQSNGSDRYFVEINDEACNPAANQVKASYKVEVTSGGGGTAPDPSDGSATPGTSIGDAGPLEGHTSYAGTLADGSQHDWYVLQKTDGGGQGTIRVEDAQVMGATCQNMRVDFTDTDGNSLGAFDVPGNTAHVYTLPDGVHNGGRYFLELDDNNCDPGATSAMSYRIEPEPASEWPSPPQLSTQTLQGGVSMSAATPISGGIDYDDTVPNNNTQLWFSVEINGQTPQVTLTAENTAQFGSGCQQISVELTDADGNSLGRFDVPIDTAHDFVIQQAGTYYLVVDDANCQNAGGVPFQLHADNPQGIGDGTSSSSSSTTTSSSSSSTTTSSSSSTTTTASETTTTSSSTTTSPGPPPPKPKRYIALGDSYSAGEGDGHYISGTATHHGDGCDRSTRSYAVLLAHDLGYTPFDGHKGDKNAFAACDGAKSGAVINQSFKTEDPQVDHLSTDDKLVTISIGGNDIGFAPVIKYCLFHKDCKEHEHATVEQDLKQVKQALPRVFVALRKHAPKAKVIVLGYPNFMPASGDCRPVGGTLKYLVKMLSDSVEFIHGKIEELDRDIRGAARKQAAFSYVGPDEDVWSKHTICGRSSWFVKVDLKHVLELHTMAFFHPTAQGQRELERSVLPVARRLAPS